MASELGLDARTAIRAGLLHDIGKAIDRETEGTHSQLGAELRAKNGENEIICNAIAAHHEDVEPISIYPILIQAADTISSTRPGVRAGDADQLCESLDEPGGDRRFLPRGSARRT